MYYANGFVFKYFCLNQMKDILLKDLTKFVKFFDVESRVVPDRVILILTLGHFCLVEKPGHKLKMKNCLRHSFII